MSLSRILLFALLLASMPATVALAQDEAEGPYEDGLPTIVSVKTSGGWAMGRSRQLYGYNGTAPVYWSTGEGVKLNTSICLPLVPIEVVNVDSLDYGPARIPVVGLELEVGTGYHLSTGGTTNDAPTNSVFVHTERTNAYVPVTLGFNARSSFGAGMPAVYVGAGGGIWLVAIYEEHVTNNATGASFTRRMDPPVPFGLYGQLGFEIPLMYSPDDGNSFVDLFAEARLTEMSNYVYDYQQIGSDGSRRTVNTESELPEFNRLSAQRSASNVALHFGVRVNIY